MKSIFKKFLAIAVVVLIVAGIVSLINNNRPVYGNDTEEIKKAIYKTELVNKENEAIEIVDIIDLGDSRFAGFCTEFGKTGIIEFEANKKGSYVYKSAEVQGKEVGTYVVSAENVYPDKDPTKLENRGEGVYLDESCQYLYIIVSNASDGYDVKLDINGDNYEGVIPKGKRTMIVFEMPQGQSSYTFNLKILDSQGNDIIRPN